MSNTLNAKLSKLVYAPMSDTPDYPVQAAAFERLVLLLRQIYRTLDAQTAPAQITLRIRCDGRQGRMTLKSAPRQADAGDIRLKRWSVYLNVAEQMGNSRRLSVSADDAAAANEADKTQLIETAGRLIDAYGLSDSAPEQIRSIASIITHHGKSLSRINTQLKTESYAQNQTGGNTRTSGFGASGYKFK